MQRFYCICTCLFYYVTCTYTLPYWKVLAKGQYCIFCLFLSIEEFAKFSHFSKLKIDEKKSVDDFSKSV